MESALKRVELPASLEEIGEIPFALCAQLTEIAVSDGNPNYKAVDGALYTKDGKQLIQYPNGKSGPFEVEEGTEVIRYGACARADISQVTFPESLLRRLFRHRSGIPGISACAPSRLGESLRNS